MSTVARNAEYTKEYNRKLVLRLLRQQPMSRAEIARQTGLTRACTSLIAAELLNDGLVRELEPVAGQRGRTPTPLMLCGSAGYALGIYLNRDGCTAGVVDMLGNILAQERVRMDNEGERFKLLTDAVDRLLEKSGIPMEHFCGIGISAPGPLDGERGIILNPPRFSLWNQTEICPILQERTGLPAFLENNATCLARYHIGRRESRGSENFLLLLVDSGIGSGVISKGKVLKGAGYFTSELGHTSIQFRGRQCECGNIGCLEEYAAIPRLLTGTGFRTWRQVIDAAPVSEDARLLIRQEAEYLGAAIVNLTNLICIDSVLLAGDLLYGVERIAPEIEALVNARTLHAASRPLRVLASSDAPGIKVLSAADVAFGRALTI